MFFRIKRARGIEYLQIVANERSGEMVRQRVVASLGRLGDLRDSGSLERLITTGARLGGLSLSGDADGAAGARGRLQSALLSAVERHPVAGSVRAATLRGEAASLRPLIRTAVISGLTQAVRQLPDPADLAAFNRARNSDPGEARIVTLSRAFEGPGGGMALGIRMARSGEPTLTQGMVTCLAATLDGLPLAAGHWSSHLPPIRTIAGVVNRTREVFGGVTPTLVFERRFGGRAMLSALQRQEMQFVMPLQEPSIPPHRANIASWRCHDVRPPPQLQAEMEAGQALRFVQIVDPSLIEREARLRSVHLQRLELAMADRGNQWGETGSQMEKARRALIEAERWDGAVLLATNVDLPAPEVARIYAAQDETRAWERELSSFGTALIDLDVPARDIDDLLDRAGAVALLAAYLRTVIAEIVGMRLGRACSWDQISVELAAMGGAGDGSPSDLLEALRSLAEPQASEAVTVP